MIDSGRGENILPRGPTGSRSVLEISASIKICAVANHASMSLIYDNSEEVIIIVLRPGDTPYEDTKLKCGA
jgi:hypothetical protein